MSNYEFSKRYNSMLHNAFQGNSVSMAMHYHDVNVFYECVHPGTRIKDTKQLVNRCKQLLQQYKDNNLMQTPDYSGLLCVLGYNDIELRNDMKYRMSWLLKCKDYISVCNDNPHNVRWCISLNYVMGEITNNLQYYKKCVEYDYKKFSPTILTKQLSACIRLAQKQKSNEEALQWYEKAILLANDCLKQDLSYVIGKDNVWFDTGFKELSEIMYLAYEASKARKELLESM